MTIPNRRINQRPRMVGTTHCHCIRCEYDWLSNLSRPSSCPRCASSRWDTLRSKNKHGSLLSFLLETLPTCVPNKCTLWPYGKSGKGYGSIWFEGKTRLVHRMAWVLTFGEISNDLHVLHHCDTPSCFNPYCLFLGTEQDNKNDQKEKGRTCKGEENGYSKLTGADVLKIRNIYRKGVKGRGSIALAKQFGTTMANIKKVVERETWKHI